MDLTKAIISSIFFIGCFTITAQNINGVVIDSETKKPLKGVNIYLKNSSVGTESDDDGKWFLENTITKGPILFTHLGYHTSSYDLKEFLDKQRDTIFLIPKEEQLDEVKVAGRRKMRDKIKVEKLAPMHYALTGFGSTIVDGKIYVIGGDQSINNDDFRKGFEQLSEMDPSQFSDPMVFAKMALSQSTSWESYSDKLQIYNISKDSWIKSNTEFSKRAYHSIVPLNGKIYVIGGKTISDNGLFEYLANTIDVYDIAKDTVLVDYVNPHQASSPLGIAYGNDILLIGGSTKMTKNDKKTFTNKMHFYNVTSGNWYELDNMPVGLETDGALVNNKLYIAVNDKNDRKILHQFDLINGKWKKLEELELSFENAKFTQGNGILYIYQKEILFTYDPKYGELKKYFLSVDAENPNIHYYKNHIYILGGKQSRDFSDKTSNEVFRIDLKELQYTRPVSTTTL
ncbi:carboxypeptidase-like regulatory domain-containing protein [Muricauda sp. 334s03]|uniref:Carboxypeptidase-like regulatory domain-containing protein n=1 Tax=Flagellimonas yonaguniensis TaxID=3031325 RepID=A0ABT5XUZ6_9FLAO|nr:carboxypeptidase-like regulatory domain-containing protein [[Muricauda] yonaguniensis]MDF0714672.1 carboxypeptidase-like regulatory domain-containing protein [[Muricauda] yonaguniensis]